MDLKNFVDTVDAMDLSPLVIQSPTQNFRLLSKQLGQHVFVKREDLQSVFSFKIRGAFNKMKQLSERDREKGVIAASAGNHAQGVACAAHYLGCQATIVMPQTTPDIKVDAVKRWSAEVVLYGDTYDEAYAHTLELIEKSGAVFIHPYDDEAVIQGQASIAKEILEADLQPFDYVFVAVGGGGLIAGVSAYLKYHWPHLKVIGVEPADANALYQSLAAKQRIRLDQVGIFADGVAVKQVGQRTFDYAQAYVDEVICVDTDEICAAIKNVFDEIRVIPEPAGALGIAGIKKYFKDKPEKQKHVLSVLCGANVNFDRLRHIAERAEVGNSREIILAVNIPEKPGSLKKLCALLAKKGITEFNYRYQKKAEATLYLGVSIYPGEEAEIKDLLDQQGFEFEDLTKNETAKLHIRYMIGGVEQIENEEVFRFQFPERPGALMAFLDHIGSDHNVTLFHYRNHGAAYGRVLMGLQMQSDQLKSFQSKLDALAFSWSRETDNDAYTAFLK